MREKPRDNSRLLHILDSIKNIEEFLIDKTKEDLLNDKLLYYATVKNLEIIGEAAYMLTPEFKESHPDTSWKDIVRMRHILVHGYYQIDPQIVWTTVQHDITPLKSIIETYLCE